MAAAAGDMGELTVRRAVARPGAGLVRAWLWGLAGLVVILALVGAATRLTGSGLSITEWRPVTGAIPPLSDAAWATEFEKYRSSSQYRHQNAGMAMDAFKTIYWWEWAHRQLGRFLGLYAFAPLLWFWLSGAVTGRFALKVVAIGALGGLQATVGWIMVASGLEPGMTSVAPIKLTLHLLIASVILASIVWLAAGLNASRRTEPERGGAVAAALFLALVFLQVALGGLVAGSKAGLSYNTWPLMDGRLAPSAESLFVIRPWFDNLVANPALVQLNHRLLAYGVVAFALWQAWAWRRRAPEAPGAARALALAGISVGQAALGIVTLLLAVPLWAGLAHQLLALALLAAATLHARRAWGSAPLRPARPA